MAKKGAPAKVITDYTHQEERLNNPPVVLVNTQRDPEGKPKQYEYDPHLDPQLQWAGKAEHTSFEVPTVSLHVHERIDPKSIIKTVQKQSVTTGQQQQSLFDFFKSSKKPLREAVEFYRHKDNWSNRLIAGDSLLVMNSLLEKEGMGGKVQMIYCDPPYGIKYGSNFQPFVNKNDVKDGNDKDLNQEPEMIKAFRDTWELGIHSYLSYLRDRLLLGKELLNETGSVFIQISIDNVHLIRNLLDEIFGAENFVSLISFKTKKMSLGKKYLGAVSDFIVWYAKDINQLKFRKLFIDRNLDEKSQYRFIELPDGSIETLSKEQLRDKKLWPEGGKVFRTLDLHSSGRTESCVFDFEFNGEQCAPKRGRSWKTNKKGIEELIRKNRLVKFGASPEYKLFYDDYPVQGLMNVWDDTQGASDKRYAVQTSEKPLGRCLLMATDPGDLVFDLTCGSGTTANVAEQWGRRWITCDTSRIAIAIAKQRLLTATYPYYKLARIKDGISSGFKYKVVPHITIKAMAQNESCAEETLYDKPLLDNTKTRITGPFTVEALPAARSAISIEEIEHEDQTADDSVTRSGETGRQTEWRDELFKTGIRAKGGSKIEFTRLEASNGRRRIHAEGETKDGKRAAIVFGPEHAPLEQALVELALEEVEHCKPQPELIIFAAIQFDPEASKDIDELQWPEMDLLRVQMNTDLFTDDLKKKRSSNESFWLIGQPDIEVKKSDPDHYTIKVRGFDYYDPKTGKVESGNEEKIAMWLLDTDYDGRSLCPTQVFFPMAGPKDGWGKLAKTLKAEIDEEKIEMFRGTEAIPFKKGSYERVAVKIVDDRGIESLVIRELKE